MRLRPIFRGEQRIGYIFWCPGCEAYHGVYDVPGAFTNTDGQHPVWTFDGDLERPTFSPSLLVNKDDPQTRCHSFIRGGKIQFLSDCWHALRGQTVELPEDDG